jgi:DNA-binding NarL/FixJ family response regulator
VLPDVVILLYTFNGVKRKRQAVEVCSVRTCVVISGHSLFAEGIASQLQQHLQQWELQVVDARQPDATAQIIATQPSAVILDTTDPEIAQLCILSRLQLALPGLKIICLDPQQEQIQVLTSEQRPANQLRALIEVIE